jgi:hypothetical protein
VADSVPSDDMRAVGISIRPIVPKSDAITCAEEKRMTRERNVLCILERIPSFPETKKGIRDALIYKYLTYFKYRR